MGADCYFSGSSLVAVDEKGRLTLPAFILETLRRRTSSNMLLIRVHETDPCLTAHDPAYSSAVAADLHRLRLLDEQRGLSPDGHHLRARRLFGLGEEMRQDEKGRVKLPLMMRRKISIGKRALIVGAGGTFEIWNPLLARDRESFGLSELASWFLDGIGGLGPLTQPLKGA